MKDLKNTILKKSGINFYNMLKYGSIACISMLFIVLFFGIENIMLAFPIALSSIAISFENIRVNTFQKVLYFCSLNSTLIILSYFASKHLYIGIIINFSTIFLISYFLIFSYNIKIYKPFLMLFVFTSFSHDNLNGLINKILAGIFGLILVIIISFILDKNTSKNTLLYEFESSIKDILELIDSCINDKFDIKLYNKAAKSLRKTTYDIYISRPNRYLTSYKDKLKLDIFLHLSYMNNFLYRNFYTKNINTDNADLKFILSSFLKSFENFNKEDEKLLSSLLYNFCYKLNFSKNSLVAEFMNISKNLYKTLNTYDTSNKDSLKLPYKQYYRSKFDRYSYLLKRSVFKGSTKIYFSLRMSITLTTCLFFSHLFNFSKVIWVSITIMSVMQIYYEETLMKGKDRIKGNLIGICVFLIVSLLHIKILSIIVLVISLYFTYAFKEYLKLSIFTSLAVLCVTSLSTHMHEVALIRVGLVLLGLAIVILANRFLFRTNLGYGIQTLIAQILFYNSKFIEIIHSDNYESKTYLAEILILTSLTSEKLYDRNEILNNQAISNLIIENNATMIDLAYLELIR